MCRGRIQAKGSVGVGDGRSCQLVAHNKAPETTFRSRYLEACGLLDICYGVVTRDEVVVSASEDMAMACSDRDRNRLGHICPAWARNMAGGDYAGVDSYRGFLCLDWCAESNGASEIAHAPICNPAAR